MKKIIAGILAFTLCLGMCFGCGEKNEEWPPKQVQAEIRVYYEPGTKWEYRQIEPGETIRYDYDGKPHQPIIEVYYRNQKIFLANGLDIKFKGLKEGNLKPTERGEYTLIIAISGSDLYLYQKIEYPIIIE